VRNNGALQHRLHGSRLDHCTIGGMIGNNACGSRCLA
jgi:FAD/FMN-containing dehydrogenase